tara:strand:+ start:165 stop:749 length:585 start_codon:yes stop_codon:yes gene_type:complete
MKKYMIKKYYNKFVAIIPARGNSKRIKNKNILLYKNKPLISYSIVAAQKSKFIKNVFVSSDNNEILKISQKYGAKIYKRPIKLADDKTYKLEVIRDFLKKNKIKQKYIAILQANSPEIKIRHINKCITHFIKFKRDEVISVDKNNNQDSAIRIIKKYKLFENNFGTLIGFAKTNLIDINNYSDYLKLIKNAKKK